MTGLDEEEARSRLGDAGLDVDAIQQESADKDPGTVLSQDPAAGTSVRKGDTVTLTIAKEPTEVAVPDVSGQPVNDALDELIQAGFTPASNSGRPMTRRRTAS